MNYKGLAVVGAAILCFSFSHASVEADFQLALVLKFSLQLEK